MQKHPMAPIAIAFITVVNISKTNFTTGVLQQKKKEVKLAQKFSTAEEVVYLNRLVHVAVFYEACCISAVKRGALMSSSPAAKVRHALVCREIKSDSVHQIGSELACVFSSNHHPEA